MNPRWPSLARGLAFALALHCFAAAALRTDAHRRADGAPPGFTRSVAAVPFKRAALLGGLPIGAPGWTLDHFIRLRSAETMQRLHLVATLPAGGSLELLVNPTDRPGVGEGLVLQHRPGLPPQGLKIGAGTTHALSCDGQLPPVGDGAYALDLRVQGRQLEARSHQAILRCTISKEGPIEIAAGLRRIAIDELSLNGGPTLLPQAPAAAPLAFALALGAAALLARALRAWPRRWQLAVLLPLASALPLSRREGAELVEILRLGSLNSTAAALILGGGMAAAALLLGFVTLQVSRPADRRAPALLLVALGLCFAGVPGGTPWPLALALALGASGLALLALRALQSRLDPAGDPHRAALTWGLPALGVAAATLASGAEHRPAAVYLSLGALCLGGLLWANRRAVRGFNALSLLLVGIGLGCVEFGLRFTDTRLTWTLAGRSGAEDPLGFAGLSQRARPAYPSSGYPVAYASADGRPRLVALGGSSTGGAFQNDDLDDFYPARLAERLGPTWDVVNQGVGGWTSLHIRVYLERELAALHPAVITLYIGHNDALTAAPLPLRTLWARYQQNPEAGALSAFLGQVRLYNGLRALITAPRTPAHPLAVPPEDMADNLQAIIEPAQAAGVKVLLISEGLSPDPGALDPWWAVLRELAAKPSDTVDYLDGAALLDQRGHHMFIDDCHLSDAGHRALAEAIDERLGQLGWR